MSYERSVDQFTGALLPPVHTSLAHVMTCTPGERAAAQRVLDAQGAMDVSGMLGIEDVEVPA